MFTELESLLEYMEKHIDLEHAREVERAHARALAYEEVPYLPLSVSYPPDGTFSPFSYLEGYHDQERMLYNQLVWNASFTSVYNSVRIRDHFPLHIRADYGVGVIASIIGARIVVLGDSMPWVEPLGGVEEIEKVVAKGIPELDRNLGARVIETQQYYREQLSQYPKCHEAIKISQPDLQGPVDIAHLLIGSDIFLWPYDQPDLLHELLELVTETYIAFRRRIEDEVWDQAGEGAVYVHGAICSGKVIVKDDTGAVNLSPKMYAEFCKPYNDRILEEFGGGCIHYCGKSNNAELMHSPWLRGIDHGNPEMQDLVSLYTFWSERKVPIIRWGCDQSRGFLGNVYRAGIRTGMTLNVQAKDVAEASAILEEHIARCRGVCS